MKSFGMAMALPLLGLMACTQNQPEARATLGPRPSLDGGSYSSGGGLTFATELREVAGRTALCGVRAEHGRQSVLTQGKASGVAASGSAYVDGKLLHRGLVFLRKVDPAESYGGLEANCVVTDRPWQAGDRAKPVKLRIPNQVVYREGDDMMGSGPIVTFRQTGPQPVSNAIREGISSL